ncbi:hypothetical protein EJB05_13231, partial [Eragrostis curvula]
MGRNSRQVAAEILEQPTRRAPRWPAGLLLRPPSEEAAAATVTAEGTVVAVAAARARADGVAE